MTDIDSYCSSKYLRAVDLEGRDRTLTIAEVSQVTHTDGKAQPLIHWKEQGVKPLGCNVTNRMTLIAMHGRETDAMIGKQLTLYPTTVETAGQYFGKSCIRFRQSVSQADAPPSPPVQHEPVETPQTNEVAKVDMVAEYRDRIELVKSAGMPDLFGDLMRDIIGDKALNGADMKALACDIEAARSHCIPTEKATEKSADDILDEAEMLDNYKKGFNDARGVIATQGGIDHAEANPGLSDESKAKVRRWGEERIVGLKGKRGERSNT